ncbi:hypothetical protein JCM10914A_11040 [Paenibacillus sp. JCM 10914]
MSTIQRKGRGAVVHLERQHFFTRRRKQVDAAWAEYISEVYDRVDRKDEKPYHYGFGALSEQTDAFVRREAERWARSCRKYRLYEDDFESHFRYTVVKAALKYDGQRGTFFDLLGTAINNAGRDLVRNALTKKNRINHLALSIDDESASKKVAKIAASHTTEDIVVPRLIIAEMEVDTSLTKQERLLFEFLKADPDATLQEMADALGVRDRKQASRIKQRMADKLRKYYED